MMDDCMSNQMDQRKTNVRLAYYFFPTGFCAGFAGCTVAFCAGFGACTEAFGATLICAIYVSPRFRCSISSND